MCKAAKVCADNASCAGVFPGGAQRSRALSAGALEDKTVIPDVISVTGV